MVHRSIMDDRRLGRKKKVLYYRDNERLKFHTLTPSEPDTLNERRSRREVGTRRTGFRFDEALSYLR